MAKEDKLVFEISAIDSASKVFRQVSSAAQGLQKDYQGLKSIFEGAAAAIAIERIIDATVEWERSSNRLTASLRATGGAVGITRRELEEIAVSMSKATEFTERQITNAESTLISFGGIHEEVFKGALKDTADLAARMGIDLVAAAHLVGRAYQDPIMGLRGFQKELGTLTFSEKEYIAQLEAAGKVEEAQLAIHDLIQRKIGGTAELMNTGLTKAVKDNEKAWEELKETLGRAATTPLVGAADAVSRWWGGVTNMLRQARGEALQGLPKEQVDRLTGSRGVSGSWGDTAEEEAAKAVSAADKIVSAQNRVHEAHAKAIPVLQQWNKLLGDQTNEQRALDIVLKGEAKTWNDLDKVKLLNMAVELDYRRVYKERMDLAGMYAKALRDETLSEEENLSTRVKVVQDQWMKGTRDTFQDYIRHAKDGAEQAAFFFKNAFQNMEDALVEFAMTGKIDFHAFANSVISDLIRIQIRQQLAGFASSSGVSGAAGGFGNFFGFGTTAPALETHTGGVIGETAKYRNNVSPAVFLGAPRMHRGGLAGDEVPAILQRGETVIPRGARMGGIVQHFHIGGNVTHADLAAVAQAGRDSAIAFVAESRRRSPTGPFG